MESKAISKIIISLLLMTIFILESNVQCEASGTIYIRADGSIDPPTAAIRRDGDVYTLTGNITSDADGIVIERNNMILDGSGFTIQGDSGIEYDGLDLYLRSNITIKNVQIKSFGRGVWVFLSSHISVSRNIIENNGVGINMYYSSNHNNVVGNNITNNNCGVVIQYSSNYNNVVGNNITNSSTSVFLQSSSYNSLVANNITNSNLGTMLNRASNNSIIGNVFTNDGLTAYYLSYDNRVEDNIVNGKPLVYLEDIADYTVDVDNAGQVILVNCDNIRVETLNLSNTSVGLELYATNNSIIVNNNIRANSYCGILLIYSSHNSIHENNITSNSTSVGIRLESSSYNTFSGNNISNNNCGIIIEIDIIASHGNRVYHNNFIDNINQAGALPENGWDNGYPSGGNYWSDYTGADLKRGLNQDLPGSDGIGDAPYEINQYCQDKYPLMKQYPWALHDVAITNVAASKNVVGQGYTVFTNIIAFNYGNNTEILTVNLYANTTILTTFADMVLTNRNSTAKTFSWNTSGFAKGNYNISACVTPVPGETDTADNIYINGNVIVAMIGDIAGPLGCGFPDSKVDIIDMAWCAIRFGAIYPNPNYDPNCDMTGPITGVPDGKIDIRDIATVAIHFGEIDP